MYAPFAAAKAAPVYAHLYFAYSGVKSEKFAIRKGGFFILV